MFETIETLRNDDQTVEQSDAEMAYRAPVLRSAGSAVKLVQGASFLSGYDCFYGLYETAC